MKTKTTQQETARSAHAAPAPARKALRVKTSLKAGSLYTGSRTLSVTNVGMGELNPQNG